MAKEKNIPQHIAIIMDGNGRWAQKRHLPRTFGHAKGASVVRSLLELCIQKSVKYLTLFAFSTENWKRPPEEISTLMALFLHYLNNEMPELQKAGVKFKVIGAVNEFPEELQQSIRDVELATINNTEICLTVAANYGGQWDIVEAFKNWTKVAGGSELDTLSIDVLSKFMSTADIPNPDLLIRTGGERRMSNFLLWQCAYTEMYFSDVLWPEFDEHELISALEWFGTRSRRYGTV